MEWISVKNDVPKESDTHVIGFCKTDINPEWHVVPLIYQKYEREEFWTYFFSYNEGYGCATEVSHWMPLPEAPEQDWLDEKYEDDLKELTPTEYFHFTIWAFGEDFYKLHPETVTEEWNARHGDKFKIFDYNDRHEQIKRMIQLWKE